METLSDLLSSGLIIERTGDGAAAERIYQRAVDLAVTLEEHALTALRMARALTFQGRLNDVERWITIGEEAAAAMESSTGRALLAELGNQRVGLAYTRGQYELGITLIAELLPITDSPKVRGMLYQNLGSCYAELKKFEQAQQAFSKAISYFDKAGFDHGLAVAATNAAELAKDQGQYRRAVRAAELAETIAVRCGALDVAFMALQTRAESLVILGQQREAEEAAITALGHFHSVHNPFRSAECEALIASLYEKKGEIETAKMIYCRALTTAKSVPNQTLVDRLTATLNRLG